jgi:hypothetical protein
MSSYGAVEFSDRLAAPSNRMPQLAAAHKCVAHPCPRGYIFDPKCAFELIRMRVKEIADHVP